MGGTKNDRLWEAAGTIVGFAACTAIAVQIVHLFAVRTSVSLSLPYTAMYVVVFLFWVFYGLRFKRIAVWLTNIVGLMLQMILLIGYFMFL
ncbi:MAG: hypothetical protein FJY76_00625 [Candidatus Aenigmarchaeota archaeon]|nr:hypothetical protein [Candidatus Aenigmarchaeota archaeon]